MGEVRVVAIGITNQRETALVWDRYTGHPLHNAIVWHDSRTAAVCRNVTTDLGAVRSLAVPPQPSVVWTVSLPVCSHTLDWSTRPGAACCACSSLLPQAGQVTVRFKASFGSCKRGLLVQAACLSAHTPSTVTRARCCLLWAAAYSSACSCQGSTLSSRKLSFLC